MEAPEGWRPGGRGEGTEGSGKGTEGSMPECRDASMPKWGVGDAEEGLSWEIVRPEVRGVGYTPQHILCRICALSCHAVE